MHTIHDLTVNPEKLTYSHPSWGDIQLNRYSANKVLERANNQDWSLDCEQIRNMVSLIAVGSEKLPRTNMICCEDPQHHTTHTGEHYATSCQNCGDLVDED